MKSATKEDVIHYDMEVEGTLDEVWVVEYEGMLDLSTVSPYYWNTLLLFAYGDDSNDELVSFNFEEMMDIFRNSFLNGDARVVRFKCEKCLTGEPIV